jgi:hypothetical protein
MASSDWADVLPNEPTGRSGQCDLCVDSSDGRRLWVVQEHVVEETAMMVPDTQQRLQNAVADLASLLVRCRSYNPCLRAAGAHH